MRFGNSMLQKALLLLGLAGFALGTVACNTTEGFGKDMEAAGREIQSEAD